MATKTIKETTREYDKDGKIIKEIIKETTESDYRTTCGGGQCRLIIPDRTCNPALQLYCTRYNYYGGGGGGGTSGGC